MTEAERRIRETEGHVLKLRRVYHRFLDAFDARRRRENHAPIDIERIAGIPVGTIGRVLHRRNVVVSGALFQPLLTYAECAGLAAEIDGLVDALQRRPVMVGLALASEEAIRAAFEIQLRCETERGDMLREEFAQLFPHPEIVTGVIVYRLESVMALTGNVRDDIETFILSDEEDGMTQTVRRAHQRLVEERHRMIEDARVAFQALSARGISTRPEIAQQIGVTIQVITGVRTGHIALPALRHLIERLRMQGLVGALHEGNQPRDCSGRSAPGVPQHEEATVERVGVDAEHERLVAEVVRMFGSKIGASRRLGIPIGHLKSCDFVRLTPHTKSTILETLRSTVASGVSVAAVTSAPKGADANHGHDRAPAESIMVLSAIKPEAFVPDQSDIDMTRRLCRVVIGHLDLYTGIQDMGVRHAVRDTLETELIDLLQAMRRHAANAPGALAERFRAEVRMRAELQTSGPLRPKRGS